MNEFEICTCGVLLVDLSKSEAKSVIDILTFINRHRRDLSMIVFRRSGSDESKNANNM